jgi:hypothetical protein
MWGIFSYVSATEEPRTVGYEKHLGRCCLAASKVVAPSFHLKNPAQRNVRVEPQIARVFLNSHSLRKPLAYCGKGEFNSRFRLVSMCMVQTRKIIAASIEIASGHTSRGWRTNEVVSPATEQNRSAPIAFLKPASLRNARCPTAQAASRAVTATNPRIRGAIMLISTDQAGSHHATVFNAPDWLQ